MKLTISFLLALCFHMDSYGQVNYYSLPADPVKVHSIQDYNWLKKTSENALNNVHNFTYDRLVDFSYYFLKYREPLALMAKDNVSTNIVLNWIRPYIKSKIAALQPFEKIQLYTSLTKLQSYLNTFNYAYEENYLTQHDFLFAYQSPKEYFDDKWNRPYPMEIVNREQREVEAFMFRRIRSGIPKSALEKFIKEVTSYIDLNFKGRVVSEDINNSIRYEFYWNQKQLDGVYNEYTTSRDSWNGKTWLSKTGNYQNGKKEGDWKFYNITDKNPYLDYEIEYKNDLPVKLVKYTEETLDDGNGQRTPFTMTMTLNIPNKVLEVSVYKKEKFHSSYSSIYNNIEYWDLYETQRRIGNKLRNPNPEIVTNKRITLKDKPPVARSKETGNYILYDKLDRRGKDHALLIATDIYDNDFTKLDNPVRDVEAIADNLIDIFGFNCEIVRNPTKVQLLAILDKYKKRKFAENEQLLIYITGHGSYESGVKEGYIVPKDGKRSYSDFAHSSWLSYTELTREISAIHSKHILLMIDACHSGALETAIAKSKNDQDSIGRKLSDPEVWFRNRIRFKTKMYITSTAADRSASDGINHSPFTSEFIWGLQSYKDRKGYIVTIDEVFYSSMNRIVPSPKLKYYPDHEEDASFFFVMQ